MISWAIVIYIAIAVIVFADMVMVMKPNAVDEWVITIIACILWPVMILISIIP